MSGGCMFVCLVFVHTALRFFCYCAVCSGLVSAANPHLLRFSQICPRLLHFGHFLCFGGITASQFSLRIRPIYF